MATYNIFQSLPSVGPDADTQSASLGTEFVATSQCWITQLRWFRPFGGTEDIRTGALYRVEGDGSGTLVLGPVAIPTPDPGSWGTVDVGPFRVSSGSRYRVVVFHPGGRFPVYAGYFSTGGPGASDTIRGPITIPNSVSSTAQGAYAYGNSISYPTLTYNGGAYFSDITVTDVDPNPAPSGVPVKVHESGGFVQYHAKPKVFDGVGWVPAKLKHYTSSGWQEIE